MLAEYQAQAKLLNVAGEDYIEKLLNRLNFLLKQIEFFSKEWSQNLWLQVDIQSYYSNLQWTFSP